MAYFDGVKVGNKVWDYFYGWGVVEAVYKKSCDCIIVDFNGEQHQYNHEGYEIDKNYKHRLYRKQTLFWNEIEFELPKRPKIELKFDYSKLITCKYFKMTQSSLEQMMRYAKLLALRDQECFNSEGYFPKELDNYFYIYFDTNLQENVVKQDNKGIGYDIISFKTEEDAQKICDILNEGRFEL